MNLRHLIAVLVLLCFPVPAAASAVEETFSGSDRVRGAHHPTEGAILNFSWEVEARLGLLLGEPVVSIRFKWDSPSGIATIPTLSPDGRKYNTIPLSQLPQDLQAMPRLMDVKVRLTVSDGRSLMHIVADVGITGKQGEWSFNVPGSPDWDEFLLIPGSETYLGEEEAKSAWKRGLTLGDAVLEEATISLYDLHEAYMKGYEDRERYRGLGMAFNRLADGLYRSYGIEAQGVKNGWTKAYFDAERNGSLDSRDSWSERLFELETVIRKLSDLPDNLRAGDNHGPYDQAVEDAEEIDRSVRYATRTFTPEGRDPATIEAGYPARLAGVYEMRWVDGGRYVYDTETGEQLESLADNEYLIGEHVVDNNSARCERGEISIPVRTVGRSFGEQHFTFPCPADPGGLRDDESFGGYFKGPTSDKPDDPVQFVTYVNLMSYPGIKCGSLSQVYMKNHVVVYDVSAALTVTKVSESTRDSQLFDNC